MTPGPLRLNRPEALRRYAQIRSCPGAGSDTFVRVSPFYSILRTTKVRSLVSCLICAGLSALAKISSSSLTSFANNSRQNSTPFSVS